eukprot:gnl/TRDRNA2_/TRDRNA2_181229_c0_seq1.p1 gnl/TRDRNA2_/TRDRNA2_181229_c0~~gnl/TRDRNA2_/TRDRNA2_181229_c0_seq1.p1  ORF type:complete len:951 (-),score=140.64 gnl/TRDRNA2_/TRDRNA2_181229_c0_seq1:134-2986(-)
MKQCWCSVAMCMCCSLFAGACAHNPRVELIESRPASRMDREIEEADPSAGKQISFSWYSEASMASQLIGPTKTLVEGIKHAATHLRGALWQERKNDHKESSSFMPSKVTTSVMRDVTPATGPYDAVQDSPKVMGDLLPGLKFKPQMFWTFSIGICVASLWFVIYFTLIYETDRVDTSQPWQEYYATEPTDTSPLNITPDLVVIFHHPEHKYKDRNDVVSREGFEQCLSTGRSGIFMNTEQLLGGLKSSQVGSSSNEQKDESAPQSSVGPSKCKVRCAMLQDMYSNLKRGGFEVQVFSSIDDNELYLCASLVSEDVVKYYLQRDDTHLQINQKVVERMGISQPPEENASSPPYLPYDSRLVEKLYERGILDRNDERELYRCYYGRSTDGSLINGLERIRIIYREISGHLDLDASKAEGFIVDWYPVHSKQWMKKFYATWSSFRLMLDFSFVQPTPMIQDYFGSRLAFSIAWNGVYCKCIFALVPLALIGMVVAWASSHVIHTEAVNDKQLLGFSMLFAIWSRLAYNLWEREQSYFLKLWDINPHGNPDAVVRPSFRGFPEPSQVDFNTTERQYPKRWASARFYLSWCITLIFCALACFCSVMWIDVFAERTDVIASICLCAQIKVFEYVFNNLVDNMTEWENHKHQSSHYNCYLAKQFLFQTVNNYAVFFYLIVKQQQSKVDCGQQGCLSMLRWHLTITLLTLSLCRIAEVLIAALSVKCFAWYENYLLTSMSRTPRQCSLPEEQAKYADFRIKEQIEAMLQLVISLGYILIFAAAAPVAVPVSFVVFAVQLRATAHLLATSAKRTVLRKQVGIGHWQDCVAVLMRVGILFNGFLIVSFGESFQGAHPLAKLAGLLLFFAFSIVLWAIVDGIVPMEDDEAELLARRRTYTKRKILQVAGGLAQGQSPRDLTKASSTDSLTVIAEDAIQMAIDNGRWEAIPHLDGSPVKRRK